MQLELVSIRLDGGTQPRASLGTKRKAIIERDKCCQICGLDCIAILNIHHKHKWSKSGDSSDDNLVTVCPTCHSLIHRCSEYSAMKPAASGAYDYKLEAFHHLRAWIDGHYTIEAACLIYDWAEVAKWD